MHSMTMIFSYAAPVLSGGAVNFIVTIFRLGAEGMAAKDWRKLMGVGDACCSWNQ